MPCTSLLLRVSVVGAAKIRDKNMYDASFSPILSHYFHWFSCFIQFVISISTAYGNRFDSVNMFFSYFILFSFFSLHIKLCCMVNFCVEL